MSSEETRRGASADSSHVQQRQPPESSCTRAELTELVRAIRFAKPDASIKQVHQEITETLSRNENFEFLINISLSEVKRVWKKAQQPRTDNISSSKTSSLSEETAAVAALVQQQRESSTNLDEAVKLYTVGDGSVRSLAREYSQVAAAQQVAAAAAALTQEQEPQQKSKKLQQDADNMAVRDDMGNFVHVFLDVPADRSGMRPYQALVSFTKKTNTAPSDDSIVKIQIADVPDHIKAPMLLYNSDRSQRTFIHPDPEDDGYERIHANIRDQGTKGALGGVGGTKAYFHCITTKQKTGPDVVSIDLSKLAPVQQW